MSIRKKTPLLLLLCLLLLLSAGMAAAKTECRDCKEAACGCCSCGKIASDGCCSCGIIMIIQQEKTYYPVSFVPETGGAETLGIALLLLGACACAAGLCCKVKQQKRKSTHR